MPVGQIVTYVKKLVSEGYGEIVLTGVDISDYGKDLPGSPSLGQMIRRVLNLVPELKRIRLSSIDVAEIDEELFTLIANEPRLMPHIHISLQAGDDLILKRMKRRHSRQDVIDFCDKVRSVRDNVAFGADIIAGFPTETDEMFQNSMKLIEQADLQYLHVFPFSAHEIVPAARMPQVAEAIRKERAAKLREIGEINLKKFLNKQINKSLNVIVEQPLYARADNFLGVKLQKEANIGEVIKVNIIGVGLDNNLLGEF